MSNRKAWKYDAKTHLVTVEIPPSVHMVVALDDQSILRSYGAEWVGKKLVLPPAGLVEVVTTALHLGGDNSSEDPAARGAVKWGNRLIVYLRANGWAVYEGVGYVASEVAKRAGPPVTAETLERRSGERRGEP